VSVIAGPSTDVVSRLRARLEGERTDLQRRLDAATGEADVPTATHGSGETEHVQISAERAVTDTLLVATRDALEDVALALARLDDGSYFDCSTCGVTIPPERLAAVPTTRRCVRCQERRERRS